jgi:hypothetical protein
LNAAAKSTAAPLFRMSGPSRSGEEYPSVSRCTHVAVTPVTAMLRPEYMLGQSFSGALTMPTDLPSVSAKRKARTDNTTLVLIWVIIWLGILVLGLLLADQSFSNPITEWEYLF